MKKLRYLLLMVLALTLLVTAGCNDNKNNIGGDDNKPAITADKGGAPNALPDKDKEKAAKGKLTIKVYYPDEQGLKLQAVKKTVKVGSDDKYTAALKALLDGTKEKGLATIGASHATAKREIKLDTALRGLKGTSVQLHPGAEKFYKDKGILK